MDNITARIASSIAAADFSKISPEVLLEKKKNILDVLGIMIAGSHSEGCQEVVELIREWGGKEEATILGYDNLKSNLYNATIANCMIARALDFDDVFTQKTTHINATIVPSAFTVADQVGGVSGKDLITAITLGSDLECRMARASTIYSGISGMSFTYQFASFGAAAVAGKLMGLDAEGIQHALGIAYSQMAGNNQGIVDGALTVRLQQGLSAGSGVLSAILAQRGITGAKESLLGKFGLYKVYQGGNCNVEFLEEGLGGPYENIYHSIKPYPCCMHSHSTIDALMQIRKENPIDPEQVAEVSVRLNEAGFNMVCLPMENKRNPQNTIDAQFSLPFIIASALTYGQIFLANFQEEELSKAKIMDFARDKVSALMDEEFNQKYGGGSISPADVTVRMSDGTEYHAFVEYPKGSVRNPMTVEDCINKFELCCESAARPIDPQDAKRVIELVMDIENLAAVDELIRLVM